jgi:putative xylitol transport system permease protein
MASEAKERSKLLTARVIGKRIYRYENTLVIVVLLALIGGVSVLTHGVTTSRTNMTNILLQGATRGVSAVGQAFVILTAGIDLSVGGIGLMSSVLGASLMTTRVWQNIVGHSVSPILAVPLMLLVGAGWGAINGLSVSRIGMPALIATLAMWQVATGVGGNICQNISVMYLPDSFDFFGRGVIAGIPVPVITFIGIAVVAYFVLNHTGYGRSVYAVGGGPMGAWLSGINVKNIVLSVYVISGFLAGLAGVIITSRMGTASTATLPGLEIDTIASCAIGGLSLFGGRGSLIGVVVGTIIIGVINNAMSVLGASPVEINIARGVIIFAAVAVDFIRKRGQR